MNFQFEVTSRPPHPPTNHFWVDTSNKAGFGFLNQNIPTLKMIRGGVRGGWRKSKINGHQIKSIFQDSIQNFEILKYFGHMGQKSLS